MVVGLGRCVGMEKIERLVELLQDGALTKEEAVVVIDHLDGLIDNVKQTTDVWWLRIVLDGLRVSLEEMKKKLSID